MSSRRRLNKLKTSAALTLGSVALLVFALGCDDDANAVGPAGGANQGGGGQVGAGGNNQGGASAGGNNQGGASAGGGNQGGAGGIPIQPRNVARVVFSGHSLTDAAVPTVRELASAKGNDLADIYQAIPGSPLEARTRGTSVDPPNWNGYAQGTQGIDLVDELRNPTQLPSGDRYDTAVVTERHDILGPVQYHHTASLLRHFHDRLRESSADGVTYLYQSWLSIDSANPQPWIDYEAETLVVWECLASKVNLTLAADNAPTNVRTLATGWALSHMVAEALAGNIVGISGSTEEILQAIFSDGVHLTPLGSLFVGAFTYSELFGQTAEQSPVPNGIPANTGQALYTMAWQLVQDYHALPNQGVQDMAACRAHISAQTCEPFWTYFNDQPGQVSNCQNYFGSADGDGPFHWPDPNLIVWPAPQ